MWRRVCSLAVEGTGRGFRALDATAFARRRRGQLFQAGAQLLGQAQLIRSGAAHEVAAPAPAPTGNWTPATTSG